MHYLYIPPFFSLIISFQSPSRSQILETQELYFQDTFTSFFTEPYFILMNSVSLTYSVPYTFIFKCIILQIIIFTYRKTDCLSLTAHSKTYLNKFIPYLFQVTICSIKARHYFLIHSLIERYYPFNLLKNLTKYNMIFLNYSSPPSHK